MTEDKVFCCVVLVFAFGGFTQVCIDTAKKIMCLSFMSQQNYDTVKLCCYRSDFYVLFWYILKKIGHCLKSHKLQEWFWNILKKITPVTGVLLYEWFFFCELFFFFLNNEEWFLFIIYPTSLYATYSIYLFDRVFS